MRTITNIRFYQVNADIYFRNEGEDDICFMSYSWNGEEPTEEDIAEWLRDNDFSEASIEKYAFDFVVHFQTNDIYENNLLR